MLNQIVIEAEAQGWKFEGSASMEVRFTSEKGQALVVWGTMDFSIEWAVMVEGKQIETGEGWTIPQA